MRVQKRRHRILRMHRVAQNRVPLVITGGKVKAGQNHLAALKTRHRRQQTRRGMHRSRRTRRHHKMIRRRHAPQLKPRVRKQRTRARARQQAMLALKRRPVMTQNVQKLQTLLPVAREIVRHDGLEQIRRLGNRNALVLKVVQKTLKFLGERQRGRDRHRVRLPGTARRHKRRQQ